MTMPCDSLFSFPYAWLASLAVAIACSLLSPFVVFKRMAFIGEGVGHAGLGGIGLAYLAGIWLPRLAEPGLREVVLAVACIATALLIGRLTAAQVESDAAIGVGLVVAMAVGIAGLDFYSYLRPAGYRPDVHDILFGEPLTVEWGLCAWAWAVALSTAVLVIVLYRHLVFYTFDEEGSLLFGAPVRAIRYVFLVAMALAIVAAIRVVGVVLVTALLVIPGLIGRAMARRFEATLAWSLAGGTTGTMLGLLLFFGLGQFTSGPLVVLVLAVMLAAATAWQRLTSRLRQAAAARR